MSLARSGKEEFEHALARLGIDPKKVLKKTKAVKKLRGKIVPKVRDRIPRSLKFYEKGKLSHAEVANSEVASDIGRYWNAVSKLIETGRSSALRVFRHRRFKDITGRFHTLETDPRVILDLEQRRPKRELFTIYHGR